MLLGVARFFSGLERGGSSLPLLKDHCRRAIRVDNVVVLAGPLVLGKGALNTEMMSIVSVGVCQASLARNGLFVAVVADQEAFERADEVDGSPVHAAGKGQSHRVAVAVRHRGDFGVTTLVARQVVKAGESILVTLAPSFVFESREGSSSDLELSSGAIESVSVPVMSVSVAPISVPVSVSISVTVSMTVSVATSTQSSAWAAFVCVAEKCKIKHIRGGLFFQGRGRGCRGCSGS